MPPPLTVLSGSVAASGISISSMDTALRALELLSKPRYVKLKTGPDTGGRSPQVTVSSEASVRKLRERPYRTPVHMSC